MIDLEKVQKLIYALLSIIAAHDQDQEKTLHTHLQGKGIFDFERDLSKLRAMFLKIQYKNLKEENQLSFLINTSLSLIKLMQTKDITTDALEKEIRTFFIHLKTLFKTLESTVCSLKYTQKKFLDVFGVLNKPRFIFQPPMPNLIGQSIIQTLREQCNIHLQDESKAIQFIPEIITTTFYTTGSLSLPTEAISLETQSVSPTRSLSSVISLETSPPKSLFGDTPQSPQIDLESNSPTTQSSSDLSEALERSSHLGKEKPSLFFRQNSNPSLEDWPQPRPLDEQSSPRSSIPIVNNYGNLILAPIQ